PSIIRQGEAGADRNLRLSASGGRSRSLRLETRTRRGVSGGRKLGASRALLQAARLRDRSTGVPGRRPRRALPQELVNALPFGPGDTAAQRETEQRVCLVRTCRRR